MMTENQRMTELLQLINCLDVGLETETLGIIVLRKFCLSWFYRGKIESHFHQMILVCKTSESEWTSLAVGVTRAKLAVFNCKY